MRPAADHILDLRDFIIPIALLKVSQVFREMIPEQTLEILCHDDDIKGDLMKILPAFSCELISMEKIGDHETGSEETGDDGEFRLRIKKRQSSRKRI